MYVHVLLICTFIFVPIPSKTHIALGITLRAISFEVETKGTVRLYTCHELIIGSSVLGTGVIISTLVPSVAARTLSLANVRQFKILHIVDYLKVYSTLTLCDNRRIYMHYMSARRAAMGIQTETRSSRG